MSDGKPLEMNKQGLQDFIDHAVTDFQNQLKKVQQYDPNLGPSITELLGDAPVTDENRYLFGVQSGNPLVIGQMAAQDGVNGSGDLTSGYELNQQLITVINSIKEIYDQQTKLFEDLHTNLQDSVDTLLDAQHQNLTDIEGNKFLDALGNLPDDFMATESGEESGSSSESSA
jgi:hypothetical protein